MKLTCSRQDLSDTTAKVQCAVTASTIPALEGILFRAQGDSLTMSGYNLELGITTSIPARIEQPGQIVLEAKLFCDIIRRLSGDVVSIEVDEKQTCTLRCGVSEFHFSAIPADDFPDLPTVDGGTSLRLGSGLLKNMVRQTRFAVAKVDTGRPVLMGVLFECRDNVLRLVAVDGYRLAVRSEPVGDAPDISFIVPEKTLGEIVKLLEDDESEVCISIGKRHIIFEIGDYLVVSRLLDGEFLDYNSSIPKQFATEVKASTRALCDCIDRISLLITDRLKSPVRCIFEDNMLKASCNTTLGSAYDEMAVELSGGRMEIGFNNRFLIEALKAAECDEVMVRLSGETTPMIITPVEGDSFLFLVMPIKLPKNNIG